MIPAFYSGVAVLLVVAVVAVAYSTSSPSLGVAEFAPSARTELESPPTTSGQGGSAGGAGRGRATTTTTPPSATGSTTPDGAAAPTTMVARGRSCVGNPARQTEDPQSPPCIDTIFQGDNGGATAKGVSSTEIVVAVPTRSTAGMNDKVKLLFEYFNQRFELYGRRLVPKFVPYNTGTSTDARATAQEIASLGVFAALDTIIDDTNPSVALHQALAHSGIINIVGRDVPYGNRTLFDEGHPYIWGIHLSLDELWQATSELVCKSLKGRPAKNAGGDLRAEIRKFGVAVTAQVSDIPVNLNKSQVIDALRACDIEPVVSEVQNSGYLSQALEKFKSEGVTSIICVCNRAIFDLGWVFNSMSGWEPEFILPHFMFNMEATERWIQEYFPNPAKHFFGVHQQVKALPYQVRPFFQAMLQMDPTYKPARDASSYDYGFFELEGTYRQLLLLASGIQGAGPGLNVDAFSASLMSMQFPNPGAGQAPYWQSPVGFGPGDHTLYDGVALAWWNPDIETDSVLSPLGAMGSWCYLGGGTRFLPGEIPTNADDLFFNREERCR